MRKHGVACESSRHPRCRCWCGGRLHGIRLAIRKELDEEETRWVELEDGVLDLRIVTQEGGESVGARNHEGR